MHVETGEMACSRRELPWLIDLKVLPSDMSITKKRKFNSSVSVARAAAPSLLSTRTLTMHTQVA